MYEITDNQKERISRCIVLSQLIALKGFRTYIDAAKYSVMAEAHVDNTHELTLLYNFIKQYKKWWVERNVYRNKNEDGTTWYAVRLRF